MKKKGFIEKAVSMGDSQDAGSEAREVIRTGPITVRDESRSQIARIGQNGNDHKPLDVSQAMVVTSNDNSSVTDSFRNLRNLLVDIDPGEGRMSPVCLIAPVPPLSSSWQVSQNLAASIAMDDARTSLLIDCDIDNENTHTDGQLGLLEYLDNDDVDIDDIITSAVTSRMRVIPRGDRTPDQFGDIFLAGRMHSLLDDISNRYSERFVILNGPRNPADLALLSRFCDVLMLVVGYGQSVDRQILKSLRSTDAEKVIGFIMADMPPWHSMIDGSLTM